MTPPDVGRSRLPLWAEEARIEVKQAIDYGDGMPCIRLAEELRCRYVAINVATKEAHLLEPVDHRVIHLRRPSLTS